MTSQALDNEFLSDLRGAHEKWKAAWEQRQNEQLPETLYHYTGAEGILGIVQSEQLWASNATFLTDSSELIYLREVFAEVAEELRTTYRIGFNENRSTYTEGHVGSLISTLESLVPSVTGGMFEVYVSCFCSDGDLLSQWRGYPATGGGYALGLRGTSLAGGSGMLRRVVYDKDTQRQLLRELLAPVCEAVMSKQDNNGQHFYELAARQHLGAVGSSLVECSFCFKHPKFQEEAEWRLVLVRASDPTQRSDSPPCVRATPTGLLPFVTRPLRSGQETESTVVEVIVGPGSPPKLAVDATICLLKNAGYPNAREMVKHSAIPLRA